MILILVVAGWVFGIVTASLLQLPLVVWLLLLLLPVGYLLLFFRDSNLRVWHFVLIAFVLGAAWYQFRQPSETDLALAAFNGQGRASLVGIVDTAPDIRQTQTLVRVSVSKIQTDGVWNDTSGLALVSVPRDTPVHYGDEVQVDGSPTTPPDGDDFSYRDYLARDRVFTLVRYARLYTITPNRGDAFWTMMYGVRDAAQSAINQLLPEPSAALLSGILLGQDEGIPADLRTDFNNTNTAHIIAISGFNIAILIAVLTFLLARPVGLVKRRALENPFEDGALRLSASVLSWFSAILILVLLVLYALLVGASASVVRACFMGGLVILALQLGRTGWALASLAIAVFLMTLLNPYVLWDIGFQLSVMATVGLLIYAPRLEQWFERGLQVRTSEARSRQIRDFFKDAFIVTGAAFLVTAPLIVLYFHRLSLIGFVTNFLILPVQPPIMILGGAATLLQMLANALSAIPFLGLVIGALAQVLAWAVYIFLQYTILVVQATAAIPFGSFEVTRVDVPLVILFYGGLFGITYLGIRRTGRLLVSRVWVGVGLVALATMFVWTTALASPDARTRLSFVAAGVGDATFIRTGDDYRILINGTGEPNTLLSYLGNQFPPWDRRIDLVVVTHGDEDNLASLNAVLERYDVGQVLEPPTIAHSGASSDKWHELLTEKSITSYAAAQGMRLSAGEAGLEVVAPTNEPSAALGTASRRTTNVVLRINAEGKTVLIVPRMTKQEQIELSASGADLDAEVAVLPNEIEKGLVERVTPETVVMFVGRRAEDKPSAELLQMLQGTDVLRTDESGSITYILENEAVRASVEK